MANLFERITRSTQPQEKRDIDASIFNLGLPEQTSTSSGVNVSITSGYQLAAVWACENLITNSKLKYLFLENAMKLGIDMKTNQHFDQTKNGSTDFGNISKIVPSLNAFLQIVEDDGKIVNHQAEFADATISKRAIKAVEIGSILIASTIFDL